MRRPTAIATCVLVAGATVPAVATVIKRDNRAGTRQIVKAPPLPTKPPSAAVPTGPQPIRLSVTPTRAVVGRTTRFRFRVTTTFKAPFRNARVTFAGKRATSDIDGNATITVKLRSARRYSASAVQEGATGTAMVRVTATRAKRR